MLVLSADGKGIVMRPDALQTGDRQGGASEPRRSSRPGYPRGEKANRKRIAEVGAVYEVTPAPRTPDEVLASTKEKTLPAPKAKRKWLTASRGRGRRHGRRGHVRRSRSGATPTTSAPGSRWWTATTTRSTGSRRRPRQRKRQGHDRDRPGSRTGHAVSALHTRPFSLVMWSSYIAKCSANCVVPGSGMGSGWPLVKVIWTE